MSKYILYVFFLSLSGFASCDELSWDVFVHKKAFVGTVTIRNTERGVHISKIMDRVPSGIIIKGVSVNLYNENRELPLHSEIIKYLSLHFPSELKEALNASGNMHNPTLEPLREPLSQAIAESTSVKPLLTILAAEGYRVKKVHFDKLRIMEKRLIQAGVYIAIEKIS